MSGTERSLQQIKRETEQTRAGLTGTVELLRTSVADTANDIRERIRPEAIKAEVSDYIRSRGEKLLEDVTTAVRKNPMQAVAVGAGIAYPLLRLARAIPVPVLMVGTGLFLAGSKAGQSATQKASDAASDLSDEVVRRAREFGNQVGESATAARTYASDQFDRVSAAVSGGTDQMSRAADAAGAMVASTSQKVGEGATALGVSLADRVTDLKDETIRRGSSAAAIVQDIAGGAASVARNSAEATVDAGLGAARSVRDKASELNDRAGKTVLETIEQNSLLVAGVGLLIGGLIASALPRSDIEDDLVGQASSAVKRQAQAAASKGLDVAKDAVGEMYKDTVRQAEAEGLTTDGLEKAAQDIGQRVRRVAESAVTAAFEPSQDNHQSNAHGGNDHG